MSLSESLYRSALEELGEGHLELDRLGAPREFWEDDIVRELTIGERIKFVFPLTPSQLPARSQGSTQATGAREPTGGEMTPEQATILTEVDSLGGRVGPCRFNGKGYIVSSMVRLGWLEWERGKMPDSLVATALLITDEGRRTLARKRLTIPTRSQGERGSE